MGPILNALVTLQAIENELRTITLRLQKTRRKVKLQEQRIEQLNAALQAKHEEIKMTRLQSGKLELELKSREEEINKYRVALNNAKTNKDYSAILTRINTDKADKSKLEEQVLTLMGQIETSQGLCRQIEKDLAEETNKLETTKAESAAGVEQLEKNLADIQDRKAEALEAVGPAERELFERLSQRYDGEVLVEVNTPTSRRSTDHTCGGCFMGVTLECVNSLMTRDEVVICPNCGRILVLDKTPAQQPTTS
ncbi:MAG: hypothetical protein JW709_10810 [Sedimentisphaerales bacterium]|nr:hypothetical protein [Sedimentisphaerales bacterium]